MPKSRPCCWNRAFPGLRGQSSVNLWRVLCWILGQTPDLGTDTGFGDRHRIRGQTPGSGTDTGFGARTEGWEVLKRSANSDGVGGPGQVLLTAAFRPAIKFVGAPPRSKQRRCSVSGALSPANTRLAATLKSANAKTACALMESPIQFWLELTEGEWTM